MLRQAIALAASACAWRLVLVMHWLLGHTSTVEHAQWHIRVLLWMPAFSAQIGQHVENKSICRAGWRCCEALWLLHSTGPL